MRFLKFLALGLVLLAAGLRAEVADYYEGTTSGVDFAHVSGTTFTQWASLSPTVASTPLEVSAYDAVYLHLSCTSGAGGVLVQYAEVSYTASAWVTEYRVGPNGYATLKGKHAPWMRLVATNASSATTPSSTYVYARYALLSAIGPSTAISNFPTPLPTPTGGFASGANYIDRSSTVRTVSSTHIGLTLTALSGQASTVKHWVEFGTLGPCTGLWWRLTQSSTTPSNYNFLALSNTAVIDDQDGSQVLHLIRPSSTDCTTTIDVRTKP